VVHKQRAQWAPWLKQKAKASSTSAVEWQWSSDRNYMHGKE